MSNSEKRKQRKENKENQPAYSNEKMMLGF